MSMPGFSAELALGPRVGMYRGSFTSDSFSCGGSGEVIPQFRLQSGVDWGAYLRCRANGGGELVCRFFAGLPPFTIGYLVG
jgi:hypothetical protein